MRPLLDKFTRKLNMKVFPTSENYRGTLFHYTSMANIQSILNRKDHVVLYASRYDCLNDFSEGTLPEIRFAEVVEKLKATNSISKEFYDVIHNIKATRTDLIFPIVDQSTHPHRGEYEIYVTSFSEDDDALAMWNYYSKGNRYEGINIGIRSQMLVDTLAQENDHSGEYKISISKVIYDEEKQRDLLSTILMELYSKYEPGDEKMVRYYIANALAALKMLFKNKCFQHEKEVRVVVKVFKRFKDVFPVKYRTYTGYIIPYIELKFDKGAVCQLTMGPTVGTEQQMELQKNVLHEMLDTYGYWIDEKWSAIPVRY